MSSTMSSTRFKIISALRDELSPNEQLLLAVRIQKAFQTQEDQEVVNLLFQSVADCDATVLRFLLEKNKNNYIKIRDQNENNLLHAIAESEKSEFTNKAMDMVFKLKGQQYLKEKNNSGEIPLHTAANNRQNPAVLRWLIFQVADKKLFFEKDDDGYTAIHLTFFFQDLETVQILTRKLGLQECLAAKAYRNLNALHIAAKRGKYPALLQWLISAIADKTLFFEEDDSGYTAIHLAVGNQDLETVKILTRKLGPQQCLAAKGYRNSNALQYAALNSANPAVLQWLISEVTDKKLFFEKDNDGKTAIHLSFKNQDLETVQILTRKLGLQQCLAAKGECSRNALQYAALNSANPAVLQWLISEVADKTLFFDKDDDGNTAIHKAFSCQDLDTLQILTTKLGLQQCVAAKGERIPSALQHAALNSANPAVLQWLISEVADKTLFFDKDDDGNTAIHKAFSCQDLDTLQKITEVLGFNDCFQCCSNNGETILFSCVRNEHTDVLPFVFEQAVQHGHNSSTLANSLDSFNNTLFHALFSCPDWIYDSWFWRRHIRFLLEKGVDHKAENKFKQNCLSVIREELNLDLILKVVMDADLVTIFRALQTNSEGIQVAHVYSTKSNLSRISKKLSKFCDLSFKELLAVRVTDGPLKGATCLHFACEAGHKENIEYLLKRGGKLKEQTAAGQSCVDFACNKGKLDVLLKMAEEQLSEVGLCEVLKLVDSTARAFKLPGTQVAQSQLTRFNDSSLKASIEDDGRQEEGRGRRQKEEGLVRQERVGTSKQEVSPQVRMLFRAFELDSSELLRSLISLRYEIDDIDEQFNKYIIKQVKGNANSPMLLSMKKVLRLSEINGRPLTLMEYAVLLEKPNLLTDLMLLPQFDIIPQTLRLLIYLKPKALAGKSERMRKILGLASNVVANALDQLYVNADEDERQLLFSYLTGWSSQSNKSETEKVVGPRFLAPIELLSQADDSGVTKNPRKFVSVIELVETLDCDDLFATECISQLIDRHWEEAPPLPWNGANDCCTCKVVPRVTIQQRFIIHSVFFVIFLLYLSWYVTDFSRTKQYVAADIILLAYALSYTLQEINDLLNKISPKDVYLRNGVRRIPRYFTDFFNYFDIFGLMLMWAGLVLKLLGQMSDPSLLRSCQIVLSISYLLLGFRSVSLLSFFKVTGPKISMLKSLLFKDLLPFLLILLVLIYSFGIFFFNLLFPAFSELRDPQALIKVFTLPVSIALGIFENAQFDSCNSSSLATGQACADDGGNRFFSGILIFVFLLLVNIVMWNLLIALFNRTVTDMASRAEVLWRKNLFEMLQEFAEVSPVPPPLSFPIYAWKLLRRSSCCCSCSACKVHPSGDAKPWWTNQNDFSGYPEGCEKFLIFQAEQLRQHRPRLLRAVERHKADLDMMKAHVDNQVMDMREDVTQVEEQVLAEVEELQLRQRKRLKKLESKIDERFQNLEKQLSEVFGLLQQQRQRSQRPG